MPTQHVAADKMGVGAKGAGKHWTKAEVAARAAAAAGAKRKAPVKLRKPSWLSKEAARVWRKVLRETADFELLDNLDTEMLAIYCDAVVKYQDASERLGRATPMNVETESKVVQSWARLIAQYADKLGFTPAARARLVKKKADEIQDDFGDEFDG